MLVVDLPAGNGWRGIDQWRTLLALALPAGIRCRHMHLHRLGVALATGFDKGEVLLNVTACGTNESAPLEARERTSASSTPRTLTPRSERFAGKLVSREMNWTRWNYPKKDSILRQSRELWRGGMRCGNLDFRTLVQTRMTIKSWGTQPNS